MAKYMNKTGGNITLPDADRTVVPDGKSVNLSAELLKNKGVKALINRGGLIDPSKAGDDEVVETKDDKKSEVKLPG